MMSDACRRRDTCRLCGGREVEPVLSLTPTPPANAFVGETALPTPQPCYPLDVFFCRTCCHVQLLDVVDPRVLFENYVYVSGTSPAFIKHFDGYAAAVMDRFKPAPGSLALDIGSNDGTLLAAFQKRGLSVLGIDPARDIAARATAAGIETIADFFSPAVAAEILESSGPARIIAANNVFAHADDLGAIAEGVRHLLAGDGVFVFEVSYLADVIEKTLFDTIYHEHLAYHALGPLIGFFERAGLTLFSAERVASHGGSIRGFVAHRAGPHGDDGTVKALIADETAMGLDKARTFTRFADRIDTLGNALKDLVGDIKAKGGTIAGFGAPAKATTLMYHFGLGPETIDFIVDDNRLKQGLYSPGHHIPVLPAEALYEKQPDYAIVLAWNFANPIIAKHSAFQENGGRFIVPLPKLTVY